MSFKIFCFSNSLNSLKLYINFFFVLLLVYYIIRQFWTNGESLVLKDIKFFFKQLQHFVYKFYKYILFIIIIYCCKKKQLWFQKINRQKVKKVTIFLTFKNNILSSLNKLLKSTSIYNKASFYFFCLVIIVIINPKQ